MITYPCKKCGSATRRMGTPHPRYEIPLCGECWRKYGTMADPANDYPDSAAEAAAGPAQPHEEGGERIGFSNDGTIYQTNTYHTSDLGLATILRIAGYEIQDITIEQNGRGTFHFWDKEMMASSLATRYFSKSLQFEPILLQSVLRDTKLMVFELKRQNNSKK